MTPLVQQFKGFVTKADQSHSETRSYDSLKESLPQHQMRDVNPRLPAPQNGISVELVERKQVTGFSTVPKAFLGACGVEPSS